MCCYELLRENYLCPEIYLGDYIYSIMKDNAGIIYLLNFQIPHISQSCMQRRAELVVGFGLFRDLFTVKKKKKTKQISSLTLFSSEVSARVGPQNLTTKQWEKMTKIIIVVL